MLSCLHFVPSTASLPQRGVQTNCRVRLLSFSAHQQRRLAAPHSRTLSRCVCSASSQPEKAAGAIALGLKAYEKADYNEAIGMFKDALTLPGSGIKQYRDKPAVASDGEKISAYYNIACCLSQTGNTHDGLLALLEALQMGYEDFQQIRSDPDLEALRSDPKFEPMIGRFQKVNRKNILSDFLSNIKNPLQQ
ncbi:hypothetical protein ABBQ32_006398 [Trebouxia sp. C0010 RCD-2024]